ncbi:MAG: hypothetical protein AB1767_12585 [Bacillota bacterium]
MQDEQDPLLASGEDGLSFTYPDDWVVVKETSRNGIATLQLDKQSEQAAVKLIVTILPVALNRDELVKKAAELLESSLYSVQPVQQEEEKEISGRRITFLDAVAGDKEKVLTRTAVFADEGRSYLLTMMAREDTFFTAIAELEQILNSLVQD